jgi:hypothetical protein
MVTVSVFKNIFSEKHTQFQVEPNLSIEDQIPYNLTHSIIHINGKKAERTKILEDGDVCTVHIIPTGATTLFVAMFVGGAFGAWWVSSGNASKFFHWLGDNIRSGLSKLLGLDDYEASDTNSLEKIPVLRGAKNQTGLDKTIPFIFGKHLLTPYYCGSPYTTIDPADGTDGENQYFTALFMIGFSPLRVSDIKIGESLLASNSGNVTNGYIPVDESSIFYDEDPSSANSHHVEIEIRQNSGSVIYPAKVVQEDLGIQLFNVSDTGQKNTPIRFSALNPKKVEIEITINGLQGYNDDGDLQDRSVLLLAQWRPLGSTSGWTNFPAFVNATSYSSGVSTITRHKNKQMRFISTYEFSYAQAMSIEKGLIEVKLSRENPQGNDGRTVDDVYWTALRTYCYDKTASKASGTLVSQIPVIAKVREKTTRLAIRMKAGDALQGTIGQINMLVSSVARKWNGTTWSSLATATEASSNPASMCLLAMQNNMLDSLKYTDDEIDLEEFGKLYEFCETKGYSCNGVVLTSMRLEDIIDRILYTCRTQLIIKDGRYSPFIDNEREYPVTVLNQQNTISATNTKSFDVLPDGLKISFINEKDGYQTNTLYVMYDGKSMDDPDATIKEIDIPFVTNPVHIWKLGRYILACMKLRPETWSRTVSLEGYAINVGSMVSVQDDTISVGLNAGGFIKEPIVENGEIIGVITDASFEMLMGYSYGLKIVHAKNGLSSRVRTLEVITEQGYTNVLHFAHPIPVIDETKPIAGDLVAFGHLQQETVDALVIGKTPTDSNTFELTLVPYDDAINTADTGEIPEYDSKVTAPLPAILQEKIQKPQAIIQGPKGEKGDIGPAGSGVVIDITDPLETIAAYPNGQLGVYSGYNYSWTATAANAGFWTIWTKYPVGSDGIERYYSFDEVDENKNGQIVCIDNSGNKKKSIANAVEITSGFRGKALLFDQRTSYLNLKE